MRKIVSILALTASLSLAACGDKQDDAAPPKEKAEPTLPEVVVDRNFVGTAGRWATAKGALPEGRRLIIDIASNGRFSMDVRAQGAKGEAIVESAKGSATKQGDVVTGTTESGPGTHAVLERYSKWTLDTKSGRITGIQNTPVEIAKE